MALPLLDARSVDDLLLGGRAVAYHGYPRATADLDVWVDRNPANALKRVQMLMTFGFDVPEPRTELLESEDTIIRMGVPPLRMEILTTASGVDYGECVRHAVAAKLDDGTFWSICL